MFSSIYFKFLVLTLSFFYPFQVGFQIRYVRVADSLFFCRDFSAHSRVASWGIVSQIVVMSQLITSFSLAGLIQASISLELL